MKAIDELRAKYDGLVKAVLDEFGAHGSLIVTYSDPTKPDSIRVKAAAAAIPYEKAKIGPPPQQHEHFHLFAHLEAARLKKKQAPLMRLVLRRVVMSKSWLNKMNGSSRQPTS